MTKTEAINHVLTHLKAKNADYSYDESDGTINFKNGFIDIANFDNIDNVTHFSITVISDEGWYTTHRELEEAQIIASEIKHNVYS